MNTFMLIVVLLVLFVYFGGSHVPPVLKQNKELLLGVTGGLVLCSFFGVILEGWASKEDCERECGGDNLFCRGSQSQLESMGADCEPPGPPCSLTSLRLLKENAPSCPSSFEANDVPRERAGLPSPECSSECANTFVPFWERCSGNMFIGRGGTEEFPGEMTRALSTFNDTCRASLPVTASAEVSAGEQRGIESRRNREGCYYYGDCQGNNRRVGYNMPNFCGRVDDGTNWNIDNAPLLDGYRDSNTYTLGPGEIGSDIWFGRRKDVFFLRETQPEDIPTEHMENEDEASGMAIDRGECTASCKRYRMDHQSPCMCQMSGDDPIVDFPEGRDQQCIDIVNMMVEARPDNPDYQNNKFMVENPIGEWPREDRLKVAGVYAENGGVNPPSMGCFVGNPTMTCFDDRQ